MSTSHHPSLLQERTCNSKKQKARRTCKTHEVHLFPPSSTCLYANRDCTFALQNLFLGWRRLVSFLPTKCFFLLSFLGGRGRWEGGCSPLLEAVVLGSLLLGRVAVQDVVVTLGGRTRPYMCCVETPLLHFFQVGDQDLVIHHGAESFVFLRAETKNAPVSAEM